jgi:hypothetical protein
MKPVLNALLSCAVEQGGHLDFKPEMTKYFTSFGAKVKVKLFLCLTKHHAMKAYWGSGGIAPRIL